MKKYFTLGIGIVIIVILALVLIYMPSKTKSTSVQTHKPMNTVVYACNAGKTITAAYYEGETKPPAGAGQPPIPGGSVALTLSDGRTMTLAETISADGARYANAAESFVFWNKGNGALVLENSQAKSFIDCIMIAPEPAGSSLSNVYQNGTTGFTIRTPQGFTVDEKYNYQALGPSKTISGVKFTIPASMSTGTNLSSDSYVSVEAIPKATTCSATLFVAPGFTAKTVTEGTMTYSIASSSDAAAGNRYEETVYALPGTNPCLAIRYFIHYGVFENYPAGAVKQFDKQALLSQFDQIRKTLVVSQ